VRWNQSPIDFLDDLAAEIGGTMKPAADKLLLMARGAGRSASGNPFPGIVVPFEESYGFDVVTEARGEFEQLEGDWFDPVEGIRKLAEELGIGKSSRFRPIHPLPTEEEAKLAAKSIGREHARKSVTGFFSMAGNPYATAEAPVLPRGFGSEIDSLDIVCACATHEVDFGENGGWITTIDIESAGASTGSKKTGSGGASTGNYVPSWEIPPGGPNAGE
jgi:phage protein D